LHVTQQINLTTRFQNLLIQVSYMLQKSHGKINRKKSNGFQNIRKLAFEILATTKWWSSPTHTNFSCLTYTPVDSILFHPELKKEAHLWLCLLYPDIVIIMCSNPVHLLLNSNAITTKNLSNQHCNTTRQAS